jgi:MoxR-like ATPase
VAKAETLADAVDRIAGEGNVFFSEPFLLPRPVLRAVQSEVPALLWVEEIDKADPVLEASLREVLSDRAVPVPEIGTVPGAPGSAGGAHLRRLPRPLLRQ